LRADLVVWPDRNAVTLLGNPASMQRASKPGATVHHHHLKADAETAAAAASTPRAAVDSGDRVTAEQRTRSGCAPASSACGST
jgi:hypothetical protein